MFGTNRFFKFIAIRERTYTDTRHAVRDNYTCKRTAPKKRIFTDTRHAVRDNYTRKRTASGERIFADTRHAVGDYQIGHEFSVQI